MKMFLLLIPFLLFGANPLLEKTDGIVDLGSHKAQKYVEIPFSTINLPPKYKKDSNSLIYDLRIQSEKTQCISDSFNHENCPIEEFQQKCEFGYLDKQDGYSVETNVTLYTPTICKTGEIKYNGKCYKDLNNDGLIDDRDKSDTIYKVDFWRYTQKQNGSKYKYTEANLSYPVKMRIKWDGDDYHFGAKIKNNGELVWSRLVFLTVLYGFETYPDGNSGLRNDTWNNGIGTGDFEVVDTGEMAGQSGGKSEDNLANVTGDYFFIFFRDGGHRVADDYITVDFLTTNGEPPFEKATPVNPVYCPDGYIDDGTRKCYEDTSCPDSYSKISTEQCSKPYTYYNYYCPTDANIYDYQWQTLNPGGFDYTNPNPPKDNCIRLSAVCPTNPNQACTQVEDTASDITQNFTQTIYKKTDKFNNTGGFRLDMYGLVFKDILCKTNSTNNECKFKVNEIVAEGNKLCFNDSSLLGEECVNLDEKCSMNGKIKSDNIAYIKIKDNNLYGYDKNGNDIGIIISNCPISGKIGQLKTDFGITSIKADGNRILFWDNYNRGYIGSINFLDPTVYYILSGKVFNQDIYFNKWTNYGDGDWQLSDDGSYVFQKINGGRTAFVSDFSISGNFAIEGKINVNRDSWDDNDFIGLVFNFKDMKNYYRVDWDRSSDSWHNYTGWRLVKVENGKEKVLKIVESDGWQFETDYNVKVEVNSIETNIYVNGNKIFNYSGDLTFENSKVGFYNHSQGKVAYSNFKYILYPKDGIYKIPSKLTFDDMYNKGFINFYTFNGKTFAVYKDSTTLEECNNLIANTNWHLFYPQDVIEEEFVKNISLYYNNYNNNNNPTSCIIYKNSIDSLDSLHFLEYVKEFNNTKIGYFCSPLTCKDHTCQYNYCPDGYSSTILKDKGIISEDEANKKCLDKYCDSNLEYENRCAISGGCNADDGKHIINQADGECYKVICDKDATYNPNTNSCEKQGCKGIIKDGKCFTVSY